MTLYENDEPRPEACGGSLVKAGIKAGGLLHVDPGMIVKDYRHFFAGGLLFSDLMFETGADAKTAMSSEGK
jgi:hypothetical protein